MIGTSGWQYGHWRGRLYPVRLPQRQWLSHYADRFAVVEVNATFYRLPAATAVEGWARAVPADFLFAVKASRYLTHVRRLRDPGEPVARLMRVLEPLGDHLGPVLLQLPPRMPCDPDGLDAALRAFPAGVRVAVEPRDADWFTARVRAVLERRGAALCHADRPGWRPPAWRTADWGYVRFHEGRSSPRPCYGRVALTNRAARIAADHRPDEDVYVFFNNDTAGCAPRDARWLAGRLTALGVPVTRTPAVAETAVGDTPPA